MTEHSYEQLVEHLPFKKYGSIENFESSGKTMMMIYGKFEAIALEKAHGAHFSFQTDGKTIECSRRNDILTPDDNFYNYMDLSNRYEEQIKKIFEIIQSNFDDVVNVQVDGELIGGSYNHSEVKEDDDCSRIQKEVMYTPQHEFFAYDIYCFRKEWTKEDQNGFYVDYDLMEEIFKDVKILYAEPIGRGSFYDMCQLSNVFETMIPGKLDLPPIEHNMSEGLVIRLVKDQMYKSGSRVVVKSKNKTFSEVSKKKTDQKNKVSVLKGLGQELMECIDSMAIKNRLNNVISKIGEVTKDDYPQMMKDFNQDILKDFPTEYPEIFESINKKTMKCVKKYLNMKCRVLIEQYLIEN
jgi:Rnl2 family RNA ligase